MTDFYDTGEPPWERNWDQILASLPEREYLEYGTPLALRMIRIGEGDNPDRLQGSYDILDGHYISALAERDQGRHTPNGYVAMTTMDLGPE